MLKSIKRFLALEHLTPVYFKARFWVLSSSIYLLTIYPQTLQLSYPFFSDDTAILAPSWSPIQIHKYLQAHLNSIQSFFLDWNLALHPSKSEAIISIIESLPPNLYTHLHLELALRISYGKTKSSILG